MPTETTTNATSDSTRPKPDWNTSRTRTLMSALYKALQRPAFAVARVDARPARIAHDDGFRSGGTAPVTEHGRPVSAAPAGPELVVGPVADDRAFDLRRVRIEQRLCVRALRRQRAVEVDEHHPARRSRCGANATPGVGRAAQHDRP